jgi:DNA polymerase-1
VELDGFEADDLLATLAIRFAEDGTEVSVLTSDRDIWQIIGPRIKVIAFKKGVSETVTYDESTLKELTGLTPGQVVDFKALRGDASDNLKGVPGIGEKTATSLIQDFGDLDGIFAAVQDPKSKLTDSVRRKLVEGKQAAMDTLPLVKLVLDVPLGIGLDELKRRQTDIDQVKMLFDELGFKTLLARLEGKPKTNSQKSADKAHQAENSNALPQISQIAECRFLPSDAESVFAEAEKSGVLYLVLVDVQQTSLFEDAPEIMVAAGRLVAGLLKRDLADKRLSTKFKKLVSAQEIEKVSHGLKDVWHWCSQRGWEISGTIFDVEIAAYLLAAGEGGHDLSELSKTKLDLDIDQDGPETTTEIQAVCGLKPLLEHELGEQSLDVVYRKFESPLIPILGKMEESGILIDRAYFKGLAEEFGTEKKRLEQEMVKMAGEDFNPASPNQLSHVLFDKLGLSSKGLKRGKTGISTAASELEKLEGLHPIVAKVGEYREVSKLLSTYVEALPQLADAEGRVHTTFNQAVTATGRLSSTNPNLQNIPIRTESGRRIRRGFIARPGFSLLSCDYSQIELRIVAALANDERMLEAFNHGLDIHTATAAAIWRIPADEVSKDQRRAAKAINFGIIYGQGPLGLSKSAGIRFDEARHFIDEYFIAYSGVREYLDQTKALAHARGFVETLFGRKRPLPEINSPRPEVRAAAERMAINMPVQGTAADIIKLAMIEVARRLPSLSPASAMLLQVHDELVFEVPDKEVSNLAHTIKEVMESVEKLKCPIVVDSKAGKDWDRMDRLV